MDEAEKEDTIRRTFNILDRDKDGNIDLKELERFILNQGMSIPQEDLQGLIEKIDTNQDGKIQYSEFEQIMEKMMSSEDDETICRQIFNSIDRKSDGVISADELRYAFYCLGEMLSEEEVRHLIQYAIKLEGEDNNKVREKDSDNVSYEKFCLVFKKS